MRIAAAAHDLIADERYELAAAATALALRIDPFEAQAHTLQAHLLERQGDFKTALSHWSESARLAPESASHRFNLALALLCAGELAEGFTLAEARLEKPNWSSLAADGSFDGLRHRVPATGEALAGKRVLAFSEQGLGDMLWAARFLPELAARGAVADLACHPSLRGVLERCGVKQVLGPPTENPGAKLNMAGLAGQYSHFVPMMSLPHVLGLKSAASRAPWLTPNAAAVMRWRMRYVAALPGARRIVGVVWRANIESASASARYVPPAVFEALSRVPGLSLVNLQGGVAAGREALAAAVPGTFDALADGMGSLEDLAAMVAATDLLISADTMAAHLAGSMGHPGLIAVPSVPNFYWGRSEVVSPWYPSLQMMRQAPGEDWRAVGKAIVAHLEESCCAPHSRYASPPGSGHGPSMKIWG